MASPQTVQRVFQTLTAGFSGLPIKGVEKSEVLAYRNLFTSDYHPPSINRDQAFVFGNELRAMTPNELAKYTQVRGTEFKRALGQVSLDGLTPKEAKRAVQSAFTSANELALQSVGAEKAIAPRGSMKAPAGLGMKFPSPPTRRVSLAAYRPSTGRRVSVSKVRLGRRRSRKLSIKGIRRSKVSVSRIRFGRRRPAVRRVSIRRPRLPRL
jgi:hypothetical protein